MALNIKDPETERLAAEVSALANETKTGAVKVALQERKQRLLQQAVRGSRADSFKRFIANEIWPQIPPDQLGTAISKSDREEILGYGPEGV